MKVFIDYIVDYARTINKGVLIVCSVFTAILIYWNFHYAIDAKIDDQNSIPASFYYRYLIFLAAFALPYFFCLIFQKKNYFRNKLFSLLVVIAPAIFSWKMAMSTQLDISDNYLMDHYWNQIVYWPIRVAVLTLILFILWRMFYSKQSFFGATVKNFNWKPYLIMLLIMVPLIVAASTQSDFLDMYPKSKEVYTSLAGITNKWFYYLLYELSYGTDFISIELFFRGFLILAFIKVAGKDAILPMACFYCTIHFGKPLGECISSYFGGILLGIVVYNTGTIWGGLVVHLGIAWLMELGGYIGNYFK